MVCDVLNFLNICPGQLRANGWRILLSFIIKCKREGVVASARLFIFFFYSRLTNNCFVSLHRRSNRPQLLLHAVSNSKDWKKNLGFIEEVGPSRPFWVRELDDRPLYPLCWRKPHIGAFESDWDDLTVDERLAALRLITIDPLDPKHMVDYRRMSVFLSLYVLLFLLSLFA